MTRWDDPDAHIGFCFGVYAEATCRDCLAKDDCLELRESDREKRRMNEGE